MYVEKYTSMQVYEPLFKCAIEIASANFLKCEYVNFHYQNLFGNVFPLVSITNKDISEAEICFFILKYFVKEGNITFTSNPYRFDKISSFLMHDIRLFFSRLHSYTFNHGWNVVNL